jgi:hypothetical protein
MTPWKQNFGLRLFFGIATIFLGLLIAKPALAQTKPKVEFILDVSNSMEGRVDGRTKIVEAKKVLIDQINQLPDDIQVGLMVYGGNCSDIKQIVPVGPVDKRRLIATIENLTTKGKTPIAEAIKKGFEALKPMEVLLGKLEVVVRNVHGKDPGNWSGSISGEEKATIVLIGDGKETCKGEPCETVKELKASGRDFVIHVIGFDKTAEERAQLEGIAEAAGGLYYPYAKELKLPIKPQKGEVTPQASHKRLPEGNYSLKFHYKNQLTELKEDRPFTIRKDEKTTLTFTVGPGLLSLAVKDSKGQKMTGWTAGVFPEGKDVVAAELNAGKDWTTLVPGNYLVKLRRKVQDKNIPPERLVKVKAGERIEVNYVLNGGHIMGFQAWSVVSFVGLLLFAAWIGKKAGKGYSGILIDTRGRYSLTHFQLVLWTIVILSTFLGLVISTGFASEALVIPTQLLGLMGISAGSAVLSTGVKGIKDASITANVSRGGGNFSQIWLVEEGNSHDKVVDITKFQNFIFTLVIVGYYVVAAWKSGKLPELPDNILYLLGIANAGYVGGKVPEKK